MKEQVGRIWGCESKPRRGGLTREGRGRRDERATVSTNGEQNVGLMYKGCTKWSEARTGDLEDPLGLDVHSLLLLALDDRRVRRRPLLNRLGPSLNVVRLRLASGGNRLFGRVGGLLEGLYSSPGGRRVELQEGARGGEGEWGGDEQGWATRRPERKGKQGRQVKRKKRTEACQQGLLRRVSEEGERTCGACPASGSAAQRPSPYIVRTRRSTTHTHGI